MCSYRTESSQNNNARTGVGPAGEYATVRVERSAFADLSFFVGVVGAAGRAKLLDFKLFAHRALVLRGHVIRTIAVNTTHLDDVSHDSTPALRRFSEAVGAPGREP